MMDDDDPRRPSLQMTHDSIVENVARLRADGVPDATIRRDIIRVTRDALARTLPDDSPDPSFIGVAETQMATVQRALDEAGV